ncbi:lytic transglycosylase domain-containing protein [Phaeovulum sp. W22_SRMD_FR3]|uniref:lytic transglycosylase domain-containing protein n=1 Tax=Phaeovulum sp. W22_SRMD_FR3 TaxID=3240274 RepID=UPI003F980658
MRRVVAMVVLGGMGLMPQTVGAEGLSLSGGSVKSRAALFATQTRLMDRRLSSQYSASKRLQPGFTLDDSDEAIVLPRYRGRYRGEHLATAKAAANRYGVPEDLFLRLVQQESGWNPNAVSNKGAIGLAQLMPGTAAKLGVDPRDPQANLNGGARYLRMMYDRFGDWKLALAAYNAGPEAVAKHGSVPPYQETLNYVRVVFGSG